MVPASAWCRRAAGSVPHGGALERGGGPADRRERTAFHGVHRISRRIGPVDGGFVSRRGDASWPRVRALVAERKAAFRLLADTGFGGERSRGWGAPLGSSRVHRRACCRCLILPTGCSRYSRHPDRTRSIGRAAITGWSRAAAASTAPPDSAIEKTIADGGGRFGDLCPGRAARRRARRGARRFRASGVPRRLRGCRSAARGELMRYRLTCLTPLLVGDGRKLSPIDYMVWKDHVNVLDQWRIFRLLAKGPRLDGYLAQLKTRRQARFRLLGRFRAEFRRPPHPVRNAAYSAYWNRAAGESLHIPTFAAGASGPYLPGAAIKGALRTGMLFANWRDGMLQDVAARVKTERVPRRPAESVEEQALGERLQPHAVRERGRFGRRPERRLQSLSAADFHLATARRRPGWDGSRARAAPWMARAPRTRRRRSPRWPRPARYLKAAGTRTIFCSGPKCAAACAGRNR
jgi:hypothetical protein